MTNPTTPAASTIRVGQANAPKGTERSHTLVVFTEDRPGSVDRVIGVLRRRRANLQTLTLAPGEQPDVVRITALVEDSEVGVDHLVEQLRKIVDVQQVLKLTAEQAVTRELALIRVAITPENLREVLELGHQFGAYAVDVTAETIILEVTGSEEKLHDLLDELQPYGVREVARSGRIAITLGNVPSGA